MSCSICLEDLASLNVRMVGCTHHHCLNCFVDWSKIKQSCPMCRNQNDKVSVFNGQGRHISDRLIVNLKKMTESGCAIYMEDCTSFNVCLVWCFQDHHQCLNCFVDWGRNECPQCSAVNDTVCIFNADRKLLSVCPILNLRKTPEDVWLDSDEEEYL